MKKILLTASACAILALAACSGTNQQGAAGDSSEKANDTSTADTVIHKTDTSTIGVDNSGSGGTDALVTPEVDSASNKSQ